MAWVPSPMKTRWKAEAFMEIHIVKLSSWRIPRRFIHSWMGRLEKEIKKKTGHHLSKTELSIAFVEISHIKKLNQDFRGQNKPTDILSFSGFPAGTLGELVLCGEKVDSQAMDHGLSPKEELGYLLIHGVLHLLGYEHEKGKKKAQEMFGLQEDLFERLLKN